MNETRELLERVGERFAFPAHAFERLERRRDRKRRNQRLTAGAVGIAVFVAMVWIAATGGPFDRNQVGTGPSVPPVPPEPPRVGFIGLPPEGATPSTPVRGELVVDFMFGHTTGDPGRFHVSVYEDGRLISWRLGSTKDPTAPFEQRGHLEQRLTPEGVEFVRAEVISTGLFDHDLNLLAAHGLYFGQIEVRNGDGFVRVTWGDCCDPESSSAAKEMPTPEQASALQRLDARLADPASWLPASAWEDPEIKAYVASRYSVCYESEPGMGLDRVLASLPRPAEDLLRTWDRTFEVVPHYLGPNAGEPLLDLYCSHVTTEEARALAQILEDAGLYRFDFGDEPMYLVGARHPSVAEVSVSFAPLLPHQA